MSTVPAAAVHNLRALRRSAGLSQEALAARCGISERTIRALEAGRAQRPHRDTLSAIAAALGLTPAAREEFVALWRTTSRPMEDLFAAESPAEDVRAEFTRQRSLIRELSFSDVITLASDRTWVSSTVRRTFEVVGTGLDRFLWLKSFAPGSTDADRFEVRDGVNVDPGPGWHIPELDAKAWEGRLRRTLPPGEVYSLGYTFDYASAARTSELEHEADRTALTAMTRPLPSLFVEARFHPDELPVHVYSVFYEAVGAPERVLRELPISPFGVAQLLVEPAGVGTHGLRWDWGEPTAAPANRPTQ